MPSTLPEGDPAPEDGRLPPSSLDELPTRQFGVYVHVPFCRVRCGYCDFNTYTRTELGSSPGADVDSFADGARAEVTLAGAVLAGGAPAVDTVFVGGGTPTMLPSRDLVRVLDGIRDQWGLAPGAEVTTEANPDSVTPASLDELARGGYTRVSIGMQSSMPHVLRTLDRTHDRANVARAVEGARAAGLHVSLDLIYGTPGESLDDWEQSLRDALALEPDHISAYALVVEEGTKLAGLVRRGRLRPPEDDDEADKYEAADALLEAAGYHWYEVSNWSTCAATRCRHNIGYWEGGTWWGVGPGAHSHVGGVRWWNVKHPAAYADRLARSVSPAAGRETLTADQRYEERILLGSRLAWGLPVADLRPEGRESLPGLVADGLVDVAAARDGQRVTLTLRGRLLADTVVRRLLGWR